MVVNSNFNKPLNEQARELAYAGSYLFESSTTFIPDNSGWYKVIVVGAGGDGDRKTSGTTYYSASGGSGGVAIKTIHLDKSKNYTVSVTPSQSSFENIIAQSGTSGIADDTAGIGGVATGGDFNYKGIDGVENYGSNSSPANVGVHIPGLTQKTRYIHTYSDGKYGETYSGYGIIEHGGSGGATKQFSDSGQPGCVLIIPLELEG
jgi:hypothetical protein